LSVSHRKTKLHENIDLKMVCEYGPWFVLITTSLVILQKNSVLAPCNRRLGAYPNRGSWLGYLLDIWKLPDNAVNKECKKEGDHATDGGPDDDCGEVAELGPI